MQLKAIFPIVDLRPFVSAEKNKVNYPTWPFPSPKEFVKYHGQINSTILDQGKRLYYCDASNMLKFSNDGRLNQFLREFQFKGYYITKRLFVINEIEAYLEIALILKSSEDQVLELNKSALINIAKSFLYAPIKTNPAKNKKSNLIELSTFLREIYLKATTKNQGISSVKKWWISSNEPFLIFSSNQKNIIKKGKKNVGRENNISRISLNLNSFQIVLWEFSTPNRKARTGTSDLERHIIHMKIFYESIKSIIRCILNKKLILVPNSEEFDFFQRYIDGLIKNLTKNIKANDSNVNQIRRKTLSYFDVFPKGEIEIILNELSKIRRNVLRRIASFMHNKSGFPNSIDRLNLQIKEKDIFTKDNANFLKNRVFISYSRKDLDILERVIVHFKPFSRLGIIDLWSDDKVFAGTDIKKGISKFLQKSGVAILIITADFLASDVIFENEIPELLKYAKNKGTIIIPLIAKPSAYEMINEFKEFQPINEVDSPFILLSETEQEQLLLKLTKFTLKNLPT